MELNSLIQEQQHVTLQKCNKVHYSCCVAGPVSGYLMSVCVEMVSFASVMYGHVFGL